MVWEQREELSRRRMLSGKEGSYNKGCMGGGEDTSKLQHGG